MRREDEEHESALRAGKGWNTSGVGIMVMMGMISIMPIRSGRRYNLQV